MRSIRSIGLIAALFGFGMLTATAQSWEIVPGKNAGPITSETSEMQLIAIYGKNNVKRISVDIGEGETQPGTVIFPNDPRRKAQILWRDAATRTQPESIMIRDKGTLWKTDRGISIGTSLKKLEALNGKAFVLAGFAWDYSGTVVHANGGTIVELGKETGEEISGRTLLLRLEPTTAMQNTPEYDKMTGDGMFLSSDPAMQKLDPRVYEMIVEFTQRNSDPAGELSGPGQSIKQIETELVKRIKQLGEYSSYGGNYDEEKLANAQAAFEADLLKFTKNRSTLDYKFSELDEHISIATSEDGKFRVYSWDLQDGGTMHRFARVYQYLAADGTVYSRTDPAEEEGMGRGFVHHIYAMNINGGTVYFVCSTRIASSKLHQQSAVLYKITGGSLKDDVRLIRTSSGLTNTLRFEYDNFSVIDRDKHSEDLINFDRQSGTLRIPVVINDSEYPDGHVTDTMIEYRFNGTYFVKVA